MNPEKFDPSDPKYKKVEDLPEEHRGEFRNVKEGGFVRGTAKNRENISQSDIDNEIATQKIVSGAESSEEWKGIKMIIRDASGEWESSPTEAANRGANAYYLLVEKSKHPLPIAILENTEEGNLARDWFREFLKNKGFIEAGNFFNERMRE
ncbi:MAG: hypothetical protein AAB858_01360 [Patescibacteria group bacterium]